MPSLFSRLFGGAPKEVDAGGQRNEDKAVEHNGFPIVPAPLRQSSGWLTAGFISKEVDGVVKEHRFVRADTLASLEAAEDHAILKAKRAIDEQGDSLFRDA